MLPGGDSRGIIENHFRHNLVNGSFDSVHIHILYSHIYANKYFMKSINIQIMEYNANAEYIWNKYIE